MAGCLTSDRRYYMTVSVHGQADLAVAENFHHDTRLDPLRQQQRRTSMTQIVEAFFGKTGLFECAMEVPDKVAGVNRRSDSCCEHEAMLLPL